MDDLTSILSISSLSLSLSFSLSFCCSRCYFSCLCLQMSSNFLSQSTAHEIRSESSSSPHSRTQSGSIMPLSTPSLTYLIHRPQSKMLCLKQMGRMLAIFWGSQGRSEMLCRDSRSRHSLASWGLRAQEERGSVDCWNQNRAEGFYDFIFTRRRWN